MNIDLIAPQSLDTFNLETRYSFLLKKTLSLIGYRRNVTVDVLITTNKIIQKYNLKFLNHDYPTDVLSFPLGMDSPLSGKSKTLLGQIIISYQKAFLQAKNYGHSRERELSFLFVHGLLHLLGYHHDTDKQEAFMINLQDKILGKRKPL